MRSNLKNLGRAFSEVFKKTPYIVLASLLSVIAFLLAVWLPNLGLLGDIFTASSASFAAKLNLALSLLGGIRTNFSLLSAGYTIAIAILFGINFVMVVYLVKRGRLLAAGNNKKMFPQKNMAAGLGGIASGALGLGCAACGSFILTVALSSVGGAGAIALLPLGGGEFGILSVLLLMVSLFLTARKISAPLICKPYQSSVAEAMNMPIK